MRSRPARVIAALLILLTASALTACGAARVARAPSSSSRAEVARLNALNSLLVDLGDDLLAQLEFETDRIKKNATDIQTRIWAHRLLLTTAQATVRNIAEPNPIVALLDMTTLLTLSQHMLERLGERAFGPEDNAALIAIFERSRTVAWVLIGDYTRPAEAARLLEAIDRWERDNPPLFLGVATVRLEDFATERQVQRTANRGGESASLFSLFSIDPLAGIDPAVREIEQTRMLADRALYQAQRITRLARWEAEGLLLDALATPETQTALTTAEDIRDTAADLAKTAADFPAMVGVQRQETVSAFASAGRALLNGLLWRGILIAAIAALFLYTALRLARPRNRV